MLPLLAVVPPEDPEPLRQAAAQLHDFDWLIFTSANAIHALAERLPDPQPITAGPRIAAVGDATAAAAREAGFTAELIPKIPDAEGLLEALLAQLDAGARILLPQAADARPALQAGLRGAGFDPTVVIAYDKRLPPESRARARDLFARGTFEGPDAAWTLFTSPRGVAHFVKLARPLAGAPWASWVSQLRALAIGPVTAEALREQGVHPLIAADPSPEGLVQALAEGSAP